MLMIVLLLLFILRLAHRSLSFMANTDVFTSNRIDKNCFKINYSTKHHAKVTSVRKTTASREKCYIAFVVSTTCVTQRIQDCLLFMLFTAFGQLINTDQDKDTSLLYFLLCIQAF